MAKLDKLAKLIALFDQFHRTIASLDDPVATRLVENWLRVRQQLATPIGAARSTLATGMEQGLRETPMLLGPMAPTPRKLAATALATAIIAHYPEVLAKGAARIKKIMASGSIRGEDEFYLIRHHVDLLEGQPDRDNELRSLYELLETFETRRG